MSLWQRWLRLTAACGLAVLLYFVVPTSPRLPTDAIVLRGLVAMAGIVVLALGIVWQLRRALDKGLDTRIEGLVVTLVIVVLAFALGFYLLAAQDPGQFEGISTRVDALYFTMSTLSTVGYGDIHATGQLARILVITQMAFNLVFVATVAAVLSSRIRAVAARRYEVAAARKASSTSTDGGSV